MDKCSETRTNKKPPKSNRRKRPPRKQLAMPGLNDSRRRIGDSKVKSRIQQRQRLRWQTQTIREPQLPGYGVEVGSLSEFLELLNFWDSTNGTLSNGVLLK